MARVRHGHRLNGKHTAEYYCWADIKQRCLNPRNKSFKYYGGRGIRMCDEWQASFQAFLEHVGPRPSPTLTIDRIKVDGHYEPGNVRWATRQQQTLNRRPTSEWDWKRPFGVSTEVVHQPGIKKLSPEAIAAVRTTAAPSLREAARMFGVSTRTIARIKRGAAASCQ